VNRELMSPYIMSLLYSVCVDDGAEMNKKYEPRIII